MVASFLAVIGLGLQLVGIVVTAVGLARTWREYAEAPTRLSDELARPYRAAATRFRTRVDSLIHRLLRRPTVHHVSVFDAVGFGDALDVTVIRGPGQLPKTWRAAQPVIAERLRGLLTDIDRVTAETRATARDLAGIKARLDETVEQLGKVDQRVATGGIPLAVYGLIGVAVGVGLQLLAEILRVPVQ